MKPYQKIPIRDCGEPLVPIPRDRLAVVSPHPYQQLGAPYGDRSPFFVREGVLAALLEAQSQLERDRPGWRIQIFDAYRPIAVQQFMVDYSFAQLARSRGLDGRSLDEQQRQALLAEVYQFWALPNRDPATPPPHSTGGAVDVTLLDPIGDPADMGSPIDEISPRSYPHHFADSDDPLERDYHANREHLHAILHEVGFCRHPNEWWHFCLGDQMWAWLRDLSVARYGGVD
ncbi:D-alanyl-D-alanine dipeptidase [Oxynema sp. CENA135]|uniref:M15 family metallopeptidase n=1 Tax=Oxynema sp. CENA135 TaxID=984206 RepID=UPI00190C84B3|nr:M15 family metallopeptidase [Oxynema sp. CENA135]MBK4731653.1 D-alanyl-D-alanine dipeptidase [Oxynema sp. CENA135]